MEEKNLSEEPIDVKDSIEYKFLSALVDAYKIEEYVSDDESLAHRMKQLAVLGPFQYNPKEMAEIWLEFEGISNEGNVEKSIEYSICNKMHTSCNEIPSCNDCPYRFICVTGSLDFGLDFDIEKAASYLNDLKIQEVKKIQEETETLVKCIAVSKAAHQGEKIDESKAHGIIKSRTFDDRCILFMTTRYGYVTFVVYNSAKLPEIFRFEEHGDFKKAYYKFYDLCAEAEAAAISKLREEKK